MSNSKKSTAKIAIPVLVAGAVAALTVHASSANTQGHDDGPSVAAEPGKPAQSGAKPFMGDPADPATWRLPIEEYLPTKSAARLIATTRDSLIDTCMDKAGYPDWVPAPDLPEVGGTTLVDWRYGIHDAELAAKRGYHPRAGQQEAYDAALEAGAVDESGADDSVLQNCTQQADGTVPAAQPDGLAQQISGDAFKDSAKAPAVVDVFAKWSSCMADKGYSYKKPMDANDDPAFSDPRRVSDQEIATAEADITCRDKFSVAQTWFDAEAALQQKAIAANKTALDELKDDNKEAAAKAAAVAHS
ncbi:MULTISPECIES: hypothetical protein [Streptomyces]|uniref:Secreted protein n=1 Tax=Streptomyces ramulosus TaxID=47762 RepID=A0ABW1FDX3_9ACTN